METVSQLQSNDIILDIRSSEEADENPLKWENQTIITMPFYKLSSQFSELDQSKRYVLYCERGVMSKLQALYLKKKVFKMFQCF